MASGKRARPTFLPASRKDDGTQLKRLRRLCLAIPGAMESLSHGEPTFFTPKRVFAMFANNHHDDGHIAVWLPVGPGVQDALIGEAPQIYFRPPYVGTAGWIGVEMSEVDNDQLGSPRSVSHDGCEGNAEQSLRDPLNAFARCASVGSKSVQPESVTSALGGMNCHPSDRNGPRRDGSPALTTFATG
jgi:hypothetical protein